MADRDLLIQTLVQLADSLVDDFDVVELLSLLTDRCVAVLGVSAAGVMLAGPEGELRVVASSSDAMRVLELFELQADQGPCPDCCRTGQPVADEDLATAAGRWPQFATMALDAGFRSVQALPMRLRGSIIGALNLFSAEPGAMEESDVVAGQALADVATIAVLQQRIVAESRLLNDQLNQALNNRVVIEQAKGVLAERVGLPMEAAFAALRHYARNHNLRLSDVALSVIDKSVPAGAFSPDRGVTEV
jgi:GAF domain-containing protein